MLSTQTNIALMTVSLLTEEERKIFAFEFIKRYGTTIKPKKIKKITRLDPHVLAEQILAKHRAKYASQTQV